MTQEKFRLPPLYVGFAAFALGLLVATLLQKQPATTPEYSESLGLGPNDRLFRLNDRWYTRSDLDYSTASQMHELELQVRERELSLLKEAAFQVHLSNMAEEQNRPLEELKAELLQSAPVSERDIERFYADNQYRIERPLDEVRDIIRAALQDEETRKIRQDLLEGLERQGILEINYAPVGAPLAQIDTAGQPQKGSYSASVEVVKFADFRCGHCKDAAATLSEVLADHPEALSIIALDYPVGGALSRQLAQAAHCARQQSEEAYWAMHDQLYARQGELTGDDLGDLARALNLDAQGFNSCLSAAAPAAMQKAISEGRRLGIDATPTLFINGLAYRGDLGLTLATTLEAAIRRAQADSDAESVSPK